MRRAAKMLPAVEQQWWGGGAGNVYEQARLVESPIGNVTVSRPAHSVSYAAATLTSNSTN